VFGSQRFVQFAAGLEIYCLRIFPSTVFLTNCPAPELVSSAAQIVHEMPLVGQRNIQDIGRFLQFRVQELVNDGILPHNQNIDETTKKISNRANGMFL
jgi:hypothetical protein